MASGFMRGICENVAGHVVSRKEDARAGFYIQKNPRFCPEKSGVPLDIRPSPGGPFTLNHSRRIYRNIRRSICKQQNYQHSIHMSADFLLTSSIIRIRICNTTYEPKRL